jgi:hypothetical protein
MATEVKRQKRQVERKVVPTIQADGGMKSISKAVADLPANRTLFINCSSSHWQCSRVKCLAGPFLNSRSVAKLELTMILDTSVLGTIKNNVYLIQDLIFFFFIIVNNNYLYFIIYSNINKYTKQTICARRERIALFMLLQYCCDVTPA